MSLVDVSLQKRYAISGGYEPYVALDVFRKERHMPIVPTYVKTRVAKSTRIDFLSLGTQINLLEEQSGYIK